MSLTIEEKIFKKHRVFYEEVVQAFSDPEAKFFRSREGRYMVITRSTRYLTIIYIYQGRNIVVITAYPSSLSQKRLYHKK